MRMLFVFVKFEFIVPDDKCISLTFSKEWWIAFCGKRKANQNDEEGINAFNYLLSCLCKLCLQFIEQLQLNVIQENPAMAAMKAVYNGANVNGHELH